jgi:tripartite-type tricarboxylate transporter receptor subunit TctC
MSAGSSPASSIRPSLRGAFRVGDARSPNRLLSQEFNMARIAQFVIVCLAALAAALPSLSQAEAPWPRDTLRVIVPFAPGGLTDVIGRTLAQELAKSLKVPAIVENRSGAYGLVGTEYVAQAKPDGHTLLVGGGIVALADALYPKLRFDPRKDLVPVAMIERNGLLLLATKASERFAGADLHQVLGWARAQPGSIAVASFGSGSISHMALETLKTAGKADLMHVPYRGTAPALPDLIGGQVPLMFDNTVTALPQVRAGKIRAIAYTGRERLASCRTCRPSPSWACRTCRSTTFLACTCRPERPWPWPRG